MNERVYGGKFELLYHTLLEIGVTKINDENTLCLEYHRIVHQLSLSPSQSHTFYK